MFSFPSTADDFSCSTVTDLEMLAAEAELHESSATEASESLMQYNDDETTELLQFIESNQAQSTIKRTNQVFKNFLKFASEKENSDTKLENIMAMEASKLDGLLGHWLISLKKENGEDYEPSSVVAYYGHIKRKLEQSGYAHNIGNDAQFKLSRKVLSGKKKNLKASGKGNKPNRAEALSKDDEEKLYVTGQFDFEDPEGLQNFVWFSFTKGFGFRGCQEAKQLLWGDIKLGTGIDGIRYLEFKERTTKT